MLGQLCISELCLWIRKRLCAWNLIQHFEYFIFFFVVLSKVEKSKEKENKKRMKKVPFKDIYLYFELVYTCTCNFFIHRCNLVYLQSCASIRLFSQASKQATFVVTFSFLKRLREHFLSSVQLFLFFSCIHSRVLL